MKRTGKLLLIISCLIVSSVFAQEVAVGQDMKDSLINEWKFHEITLRTPKDGYLIRLSKKTVDIMELMVVNYKLNSDGSVTLDADYMEKQGIKEAKWELSDNNALVISYFWTPEKQETAGFTNSYEKIEFKIDKISDKELVLSLYDMVIVTLVSK